MKIGFAILVVWCVTFASGFSAAAQTQQNGRSLDTPDSPKTIAAKREIIKILFSDIFRGERKETISLLTLNIPSELQENFPKLTNLSVELVPAESDNREKCHFVFHAFSVSQNTATVSFGNCNDGLGYNFEKIKGKWKFASSVIESR